MNDARILSTRELIPVVELEDHIAVVAAGRVELCGPLGDGVPRPPPVLRSVRVAVEHGLANLRQLAF